MLEKWDALIDPAALAPLREMAGDGAIREVLTTFLESSLSHVVKMRQAAAAGDARALSATAHMVKGSSGTVGAKRVSRFCARIEVITMGGTLDGVAELLDAIDEDVARAQAALKAWKGGG